jgi:diketogulonate reductase-like aldo/keto reductase
VIDSSPMYGRAESVVGDLTDELHLRDKLFLATKVWTSGNRRGSNRWSARFSACARRSSI